jgi:hypothetical protein
MIELEEASHTVDQSIGQAYFDLDGSRKFVCDNMSGRWRRRIISREDRFFHFPNGVSPHMTAAIRRYENRIVREERHECVDIPSADATKISIDNLNRLHDNLRGQKVDVSGLGMVRLRP